MAVKIHPSVDNGVKPGTKDFKGGTLTCQCASNPVAVTLASDVAFNHVCGCTKCWKPEGAVFSVVAVVGRDKLSVTANGKKLKVVDPAPRSSAMPAPTAACTCTAASRTRTIRSTASTSCTPSCRRTQGWAAPEFAAFVSSIIETGSCEAGGDGRRARAPRRS